jgi:polar amino acid transport system substrate-binding protein
MKNIVRLVSLVTLAGLCLAASAAPRARLYIATEKPPTSVMFKNGKLVGVATEKVRGIMERVDIDHDIEILPFKRAYLLARTRSDVCTYSLTRLPEREAMFKWVGPIQSSDWTFYGRAGRQYQLSTLEDARKYSIGAYFGDVRGEALERQGFNVSIVTERLSNPRKLLADRIDLWISSLQMGGGLVADNGWSGQIVPLLTIKRTELYLACNLGVPDALIGRMNAALRAMDAEGVSAAIERKYNGLGSKPKP